MKKFFLLIWFILLSFSSIAQTSVCTTPEPTFVSPIVYCLYQETKPLTATGSNLKWYSGPVGFGQLLPGPPTPYSDKVSSQYYYVSQTIGCEGPRAKITVVVSPTLAPPQIGNNVSGCEGEVQTLWSASTASDNKLLWYTSETGGTGSTTIPPIAATPAGKRNVWVSSAPIQTFECESKRVQISKTIYPIPLPPSVISPVVYCEGDSSKPLSAMGTAIRWYSVPAGGGSTPTTPVPSTSKAKSSKYYPAQNVDGCVSPRAEIAVTVHPKPSVSIESPANHSVTYINSLSITTSATGSDISSVKFYNATEFLSEFTLSPYSYQWNGVSNGNYTLQAKITTAFGCTDTAKVIVQVNAVTTGLYSEERVSESIFPNPFLNGFTIQRAGDDDYFLLNAEGTLVEKGTAHHLVSEVGSNLQPGCYFLRFANDPGGKAIKMIKIR